MKVPYTGTGLSGRSNYMFLSTPDINSLVLQLELTEALRNIRKGLVFFLLNINFFALKSSIVVEMEDFSRFLTMTAAMLAYASSSKDREFKKKILRIL